MPAPTWKLELAAQESASAAPRVETGASTSSVGRESHALWVSERARAAVRGAQGETRRCMGGSYRRGNPRFSGRALLGCGFIRPPHRVEAAPTRLDREGASGT